MEEDGKEGGGEQFWRFHVKPSPIILHLIESRKESRDLDICHQQQV